MIDITVCKADPIDDGEGPLDTHIHIADRIPAAHHGESFDLAQWESFLESQAGAIERVLHASLPGGVYDRLLGRMLARKASSYRVAYADLDKGAAQ